MQTQQMSLLQTEIKDLQADNVKLYEKIKYLQGYQVKEDNLCVLYKYILNKNSDERGF